MTDKPTERAPQFTPGPWTLEHDADGDFAIFARTRLIAITDKDNEGDHANARLIAASPALFEALNRMLVSFAGDEELCMECGAGIGQSSDCDSCYVIGEAIKAVEKVWGESQ